MADDAQAMHRDFPRWYAAVSLGSDAARQGVRWTALQALTQQADSALIEALVRLAFGTRQAPSSEALARIHAAYRAADDTFEASRAAREMQVLAAASLAVLSEGRGGNAATAALSVATASMAGGRSAELPMDLPALAEAAIERLADANRTRPNLAGLVSAEPPKVDFEGASAKAKEGSWDAVALAFTAAATSTRTALRGLAARQASAVSAIDRFLQVQDEELQMLWWVFGGRSIDLNCAFGTVPADAQPLVFASELADCTASLPGPRSIAPLLARAGLKERKRLTIASALGAAGSPWLTTMMGNGDPSPVTRPLHFAIQRCLEAGGGDTWLPNWAAVAGVDAARPYPAPALSLLFYRERLLTYFA